MQAADSAQPKTNTTTTDDATKDSGSTNLDHGKTQGEKDDTLTQAIEAEMDEMETGGLEEDLKTNQLEPMSKVEENEKDRVDVQC